MNRKVKFLWILYGMVLAVLFLLSSTDLIIKEEAAEVYPVSVIIGDTSDENYVNFRKGMERAAIKRLGIRREAAAEGMEAGGEYAADKRASDTVSTVDIQFAKDNGRNSNERILDLHKAGKSNMAIAKELGLGLGEVKLVIDLLEGV